MQTLRGIASRFREARTGGHSAPERFAAEEGSRFLSFSRVDDARELAPRLHQGGARSEADAASRRGDCIHMRARTVFGSSLLAAGLAASIFAGCENKHEAKQDTQATGNLGASASIAELSDLRLGSRPSGSPLRMARSSDRRLCWRSASASSRLE